MPLNVLYFASVRERVGSDQEVFDLPEAVLTVSELVRWLSAKDARYAIAFADMCRLRCAVDQEMAPLSASLSGVKEVAFFPPVTGG